MCVGFLAKEMYYLTVYVGWSSHLDSHRRLWLYSGSIINGPIGSCVEGFGP